MFNLALALSDPGIRRQSFEVDGVVCLNPHAGSSAPNHQAGNAAATATNLNRLAGSGRLRDADEQARVRHVPDLDVPPIFASPELGVDKCYSAWGATLIHPPKLDSEGGVRNGASASPSDCAVHGPTLDSALITRTKAPGASDRAAKSGLAHHLARLWNNAASHDLRSHGTSPHHCLRYHRPDFYCGSSVRQEGRP